MIILIGEGTFRAFQIKPKARVRDLKGIIATVTKIPPDRQRIELDGAVIHASDNALLAGLGYHIKSTLKVEWKPLCKYLRLV